MTEPTTPDPTPQPPGGPTPEAPRRRRSLSEYLTDPSARRIEWLALGLILAVGVLALITTRGDLVAQAVPADAEVEAEPEPAVPSLPSGPYELAGLDLHPDRIYSQYFSDAFITRPSATDSAAAAVGGVEDFRQQLEIYRHRAGVDDNFTIRVYDNRTWKTLETFTLREQKERYESTGEVNWDRIDALRRQSANGLIRKWTARGVPKSAISTRWGRANQMREARQREEHMLEYEIRYARQLGLSLLTTEIGSVETFNQDWMESPVKARSRYQMMPDILELFDIEAYTLPAEAGSVQVREWLNPLLSMQSSFLLVRGYTNAVGHEIPGVSAYHTGPGNIFHLYQTYLRAKSKDPTIEDATVIEAYMWGVTDGFQRVRAQSSFGPHSRGYVLSAYGALRAVDGQPLDPEKTLRTEQVSLAAGETVALRDLLDLLQPHGGRLDWGHGIDAANLYERFRELNPHMALPRSGSDETVAVPASGNVRLSATAEGDPVRFYLPYGASDLLDRLRPGLLNPDLLVRFDEDTFADPALTGEQTQWDRAYDELVRDVANFGFTTQNRSRLESLYSRMQQLAAENPTRYRKAQAKIITIHRRVWGTAAFRDLAGTVQNVLAGSRFPVRPLEPASPAQP